VKKEWSKTVQQARHNEDLNIWSKNSGDFCLPVYDILVGQNLVGQETKCCQEDKYSKIMTNNFFMEDGVAVWNIYAI